MLCDCTMRTVRISNYGSFLQRKFAGGTSTGANDEGIVIAIERILLLVSAGGVHFLVELMANYLEEQTAGGQETGNESRGRWWGVLLAVAVLVAYLPVWKAGYIWIDDAMLTGNGCVVGPFGLKEIWTTYAADGCPFTITTLWLEYHLWGLVPLPYHLVSVLFHAANAVVLWRVLLRLRIPGAWLGAMFWALHPVQVESVAWISEMKNTESGLFFLLSILFFIEWQRLKDSGQTGRTLWMYALVLLFAALAMASDSTTVVLPVVLCLCAWWMDVRWFGRIFWKLLPIFFLSLVFGIASLWTQALRAPAGAELFRLSGQNLATAGAAAWFYLSKLIWPYPLMVAYPRALIDPGKPFLLLPLLTVVGALVILGLNRNKWARPWFFAVTYFVVVLFPVLGLIDNSFFEYSPVFDHFQYLASMGPLALAGAGVVWLANLAASARLWVQTGLGAIAALTLGISTWQYAHVFKDDGTLWTYVLEKDPRSWLAYKNLGMLSSSVGKIDEAIGYFQKSLEINPTNPASLNALGLLFEQKGKVEDATSQFNKAIESNPNYNAAHENLGNIYATNGELEKAISEYEKALETDPNNPDLLVSLGVALAQKGDAVGGMGQFAKALALYPNSVEAHYNLGNALLQTGDADAAVVHYRKAEELDPGDFRIHNNLGRALAQKNELDDAIAEFRKANEGDPNNVAVYQNLSRVLGAKGKVDDAIEQLRKAVEIDNHDAKSHNLLGNFLFQKGDMDAAISEYQSALDIDPAFAECRRNLGFALFKKGKLDDAIYQYERSLALNPDDAAAHNNLGIIYAQQGKLEKAIPEFDAALQLQPDFEDAEKNLGQAQAMIQQKSGAR